MGWGGQNLPWEPAGPGMEALGAPGSLEMSQASLDGDWSQWKVSGLELDDFKIPRNPNNSRIL